MILHSGRHLKRACIVARLREAGCVFAEDEADVLLATTSDPATLDEMMSRRARGAPLGAGRGLG